MTSLQATSGAGRSPGVAALDIIDNVIPYIAKEEEKVERETKKILGRLDPQGEGIAPAEVSVSCTCTRVNVLEGHTEGVTRALFSPDGRRALTTRANAVAVDMETRAVIETFSA